MRVIDRAALEKIACRRGSLPGGIQLNCRGRSFRVPPGRQLPV